MVTLMMYYSALGQRFKEIVLPKGELDKANKDKKRFPHGFKVWTDCIVLYLS